MNLGRRLIAVLPILGSMIPPLNAAASPVGSSGPGPSVISLPEGLIAEWSAPQPQVIMLSGGESELDMAGWPLTQAPGTAQIPYSAVLVAIPPGSAPTLEILSSDNTTIGLPAPLPRAPQPSGVQRTEEGQILGGSFSPAETEQSLDLQPVMLEPIGILRGVHLARLTFYPAIPREDTLQVTTRISVQVDFNTGPALVPSQDDPAEASSPDDPLLRTVHSAVINPEQLQVDPAKASSPNATRAPSPDDNAPKVAIQVAQTGLTKISYEALSGIGFPVSTINPQYLHLTRGGEEVSYEWVGDGDGTFEFNEEIRFFAEPRFSRWASFDIYFLQSLDTPGLRMDSRPAIPGSLPEGTPWVEATFETNALYTPDCYCAPIPAGRDGDRWVWDHLLYTDYTDEGASGDYPFNLVAVDPARDASLSIWMIGFTDLPPSPDHRVLVSVNGIEVGEIVWDGKISKQDTFSIPPAILIEGENELSLSLPGLDGVAIDGSWLDAFSIRYARKASQAAGASLLFTGEDTPHAYTASLAPAAGIQVFDVTDGDHPLKLGEFEISGTNEVTLGDDPNGEGTRRYWLTTDNGILEPQGLRLISQQSLAENFEGADYLIISPQEFMPALNALIQLRESQGLKVATEDVQAIYDVYGEGSPQPSAITAFLADAYQNWTQRPAYVLLVGDGTSDPKRYLASSSATFIPPYLAEVDPWAGETAADNRYVTVDGADSLPDMLIGRLPANSPDEVTDMVAKIVGYEAQPAGGSWKDRATFVADNPDSGGNFPLLTDNLLAKFPSPPFLPERLNFSPLETTPEAFRDDLLESWSAGTSLLMYTGHSSIHQWAVEVFFHLEDVQSLANGPRLPVVLEMTCFTGAFQVPGFPTLDESLLRHPDGGAVAVWGPAGLGIATGHHWLAEGFMENVYGEGIIDLGSATLAGKINVATENVFTDLIDTYNLLGDPATNLVRSYHLYMPITSN